MTVTVTAPNLTGVLGNVKKMIPVRFPTPNAMGTEQGYFFFTDQNKVYFTPDLINTAPAAATLTDMVADMTAGGGGSILDISICCTDIDSTTLGSGVVVAYLAIVANVNLSTPAPNGNTARTKYYLYLWDGDAWEYLIDSDNILMDENTDSLWAKEGVTTTIVNHPVSGWAVEIASMEGIEGYGRGAVIPLINGTVEQLNTPIDFHNVPIYPMFPVRPLDNIQFLTGSYTPYAWHTFPIFWVNYLGPCFHDFTTDTWDNLGYTETGDKYDLKFHPLYDTNETNLEFSSADTRRVILPGLADATERLKIASLGTHALVAWRTVIDDQTTTDNASLAVVTLPSSGNSQLRIYHADDTDTVESFTGQVRAISFGWKGDLADPMGYVGAGNANDPETWETPPMRAVGYVVVVGTDVKFSATGTSFANVLALPAPAGTFDPEAAAQVSVDWNPDNHTWYLAYAYPTAGGAYNVDRWKSVNGTTWVSDVSTTYDLTSDYTLTAGTPIAHKLKIEQIWRSTFVYVEFRDSTENQTNPASGFQAIEKMWGVPVEGSFGDSWYSYSANIAATETKSFYWQSQTLWSCGRVIPYVTELSTPTKSGFYTFGIDYNPGYNGSPFDYANPNSSGEVSRVVFATPDSDPYPDERYPEWLFYDDPTEAGEPDLVSNGPTWLFGTAATGLWNITFGRADIPLAYMQDTALFPVIVSLSSEYATIPPTFGGVVSELFKLGSRYRIPADVLQAETIAPTGLLVQEVAIKFWDDSLSQVVSFPWFAAIIEGQDNGYLPFPVKNSKSDGWGTGTAYGAALSWVSDFTARIDEADQANNGVFFIDNTGVIYKWAGETFLQQTGIALPDVANPQIAYSNGVWLLGYHDWNASVFKVAYSLDLETWQFITDAGLATKMREAISLTKSSQRVQNILAWNGGSGSIDFGSLP